MTDKPSQWTIYDRILADVEELRRLNRERIAFSSEITGKSGLRSSRQSPFASGEAQNELSRPGCHCRA